MQKVWKQARVQKEAKQKYWCQGQRYKEKSVRRNRESKRATEEIENKG